jgi:hypothetical protein
VVVPHAGICAGGGPSPQSEGPSLPRPLSGEDWRNSEMLALEGEQVSPFGRDRAGAAAPRLHRPCGGGGRFGRTWVVRRGLAGSARRLQLRGSRQATSAGCACGDEEVASRPAARPSIGVDDGVIASVGDTTAVYV